MKRIVHILLMSVVLCLSGCQGSHWLEDGSELDYIDSLSAKDPQRAIQLLDSITTGFEQEGEIIMLAHAYYLEGRAYTTLNDAPQALRYYQKSLEASNKAHLKTDLVARNYTEMGNLFVDHELYDDALQAFLHLQENYSMQNDTVGIISSYWYIGNCYLNQANYSKAMDSFDRGLSMASLSNKPALSGLFCLEEAKIFKVLGLETFANAYMSYYKLEEIDEAYRDYADGILTCLRTGEGLQEKKPMVSQSVTNQMTKINMQYENNQLEKQNDLLIREKAKHTYTIVIIGLLVFVIAVLLVAYLSDKRDELSRLKSQVGLNKQADGSWLNDWLDNQSDPHKAAIRESAIFKRLSQTTGIMKTEDMDEATALLNQVYPSFMHHLHILGVTKDQDLKVSVLLKLGIELKQIACLLAKEQSAITNCRVRLYKKVFHETGKAGDWDKVIASI